MTLSVIIPVLNARSTLPRAVDSVLAQDLSAEIGALTLIVVDNGSTDGSWEWLHDRAIQSDAMGRLHLLREPTPGPSSARNTGIRAALALQPPPEVILLLDADCEAPPNWSQTLLQALLDHPDWDAVGGPLCTRHFDNYVQEFIERQGIMDVSGFFHASPPRPPMVLTANLALRPRAIQRIGLFNPALPVGEDADWCWRLQWAGGQLGFVPEAPVEHRHRATPRGLARMMYRYGQGSIRVHRLHRNRLGPLDWDWVGAARLARALLKCVLIPVRRLTPYQRVEAPLEVIRYGAFLMGRWHAWLFG